MWVECGATKSNKANVGGVWGNAKKQNKCGASAKRVQKKSKMAKQGAKTIQMWVRIQKIKTKNQCKKASQNVGAGR